MPSKRFQALVLENYVHIYVRDSQLRCEYNTLANPISKSVNNDVLPSDLDDARSIVEASATRARRTPTKFDVDIFDTILRGKKLCHIFKPKSIMSFP